MTGYNGNVIVFDEILLHTARPGVDTVLEWLRTTDFYSAPGSTRFHDCKAGGLLDHSLNVYFLLLRLAQTFDPGVALDSLAITALLHDVCKAGCYKETTRNVKEDGKWRAVPYWTFEEGFAFGGHGSKSVFLLMQHGLELTPEEATAINCHMGVENGKWEVAEAFRRCPLAFLLHTADMASTIPALIDNQK